MRRMIRSGVIESSAALAQAYFSVRPVAFAAALRVRDALFFRRSIWPRGKVTQISPIHSSFTPLIGLALKLLRLTRVEDFPRSILYSVNQLHRYFERLKGERNQDAFRNIDFMIGKIKSKVRYSTVESIMAQGLHAYLNGIKDDLYRVGIALNQNYFAYT